MNYCIIKHLKFTNFVLLPEGFLLTLRMDSDSVVCSSGSYLGPTQFEFHSDALLTQGIINLWELSINCTMAWVADRQVRAMLYATLAAS